ncbi:hypothetical protein ACMWEF_001588 [Campylobacter jejuni]|nr:hypothetical protein [Campylobacter jejuni]EAJ2975626.1 hypothetical protein [Campylobacter jejuni]ECP7253997.1 hypothetical protein [Campylobacter jejuni]ECP7577851.1 hypothetical protein [Campylobacter jejuni]EDP2897563.1 hypothetical protein [Campylobacter jejuni]EEP3556548.1 hypothetical protein [Campylobacter jejuni]
MNKIQILFFVALTLISSASQAETRPYGQPNMNRPIMPYGGYMMPTPPMKPKGEGDEISNNKKKQHENVQINNSFMLKTNNSFSATESDYSQITAEILKENSNANLKTNKSMSKTKNSGKSK